MESLPKLLKPWIAGAFLAVAQPWADATEQRRFCWKICFLNAGIWAFWQFRRFEPSMRRSFMHNPLSGLSYTMLTSVFSHRSFIHLLCNCLALESFGASTGTYFSRVQPTIPPQDQLESSPTHHFAAFFVTGAYPSSSAYILE